VRCGANPNNNTSRIKTAGQCMTTKTINPSVSIWVDADACPVAIKQILYKAANRTQIFVYFLANHPLTVPKSRYLDFIQVPQGIDAADHVIVQKVSAQDLVVTADIPLASEVIAKGALALNPRGNSTPKTTLPSVCGCAMSWNSCVPAASRPVAHRR